MDNMVDFHFVLLVLRGRYIISDLKIYGKIFSFSPIIPHLTDVFVFVC